MNRPASSKYVPGLPADDDIDSTTNENASSKPDSIKIYDGVAECTINDADTLKSIKIRAKDLAIQKVQLKIADYVYGFWKDRYLTLPDDEVLSIANEICTITDVKYNMQDSDDDKMIVRATVLAQVDDNVLMNYIIQFFKERNELKLQNEALRKEIADLKQQQDKTSHAIENQNNSLRNENSDLKRQIEDLKRQKDSVTREKSAIENQNKSLRNENSDLKRQIEDLKRQRDSVAREKSALESKNNELRRQIVEIPRQFISKDKIELASKKSNEAYQLFLKNNNMGAITLYDEAINLNQNDAWVYFNRGTVYKEIGQYYKAIQDFSKAIQLNPNAPKFYLSRGNCYKEMRNMAAAQEDFNKYKKLS